MWTTRPLPTWVPRSLPENTLPFLLWSDVQCRNSEAAMENVPAPAAGQNSLPLVLYYIFKVIPMLIGGMSIWLGYRLFILGVTGQASLSVNSTTVSGQLLNAAPGLFFAVGGVVANIVAVWKGVKIHFTNDRGQEEGYHADAAF